MLPTVYASLRQFGALQPVRPKRLTSDGAAKVMVLVAGWPPQYTDRRGDQGK
jgi:hypothetical protein